MSLILLWLTLGCSGGDRRFDNAFINGAHDGLFAGANDISCDENINLVDGGPEVVLELWDRDRELWLLRMGWPTDTYRFQGRVIVTPPDLYNNSLNFGGVVEIAAGEEVRARNGEPNTEAPAAQTIFIHQLFVPQPPGENIPLLTEDGSRVEALTVFCERDQ